MKFRYDINVLRAAAVLAVMFFHFRARLFEGGFSGVDVFFVISGYLMTRIIANGLSEGTFSLKEFYAKRLKRIVPALLVLTGVVIALEFFITFPVDYRETEKNAFSSILFLSNFVYWRDSGYFAPASDRNIFLHTWSLSVEWQFYLLYPIIIRWLSNIIKNKTTYKRFFIALTVLLAIMSFIVTRIDATTSFYLLPTRAWEMMIGGIACYSEGIIRDRRKQILIALSGYIMILYSFVFLEREMAWPGVYSLLPVMGTFLVILANWNEWKLIRLNIAQFFGKISYSLYLWHWPVVVLATYVGVIKNKYSFCAFVAISIMLAVLSYKFVESVKYKSNKKILVSMAVLSSIILVFIIADANAFLFTPESRKLSSYASDHKEENRAMFRADTCFVELGQKYDRQRCLCTSDTLKNVLLIGDSHAAQLSASLAAFCKERGIMLSQATGSACIPVLNANVGQHCKDVIDYVYSDYIVKHAEEIDGVIITANWLKEVKNCPRLLKNINKTIDWLRKYNLNNVIVIGQTETYTMSYAYIAAWESELGRNLTDKFKTSKSAEVNEFLKSNLKAAPYVDVYNRDTVPSLSVNADPYMIDMDHVTVYGSKLLVHKIFSDSAGIRFLNDVASHRKVQLAHQTF